MACRSLAKLRLIRASASVAIRESLLLRLGKLVRARRAYIMLRAPSSRAWRKWPEPLAAQPFRSIEALRFFSFAGLLHRFDLGKQTVPAHAPSVVGRHRDVRQFRAPASSFLLAGHRGS